MLRKKQKRKTKAESRRITLGADSREMLWKNLQARALKKSSSRQADTVWGLTLLINFPDEKSSIPKSQTEDFFNKQGYGENGSISDYFQDVSNGKLIYFNRVTMYVTVSKNKSY